MNKLDSEPYKPNKHTRYVPMDEWRKLDWASKKPQQLTIVDPGYTNEPDDEPTK